MKKFKTIISRFKTFIYSKRQYIINCVFLSLFSSVLFFFSTIFVSNLKTNIPNTVIEIEERLKSELNGEQPYCLIYPKETTSFYNMAYRDPEKSTEIRSIFEDIECFDWYLGSHSDNYKPFIYDFSDGTSVNLSLSMFPKPSYVQNKFFYDISLITGGVKNITSPNDIFINQSFADKLMNDEHVDSYSELIGKKITAISKIKVNTLSIEYTISGVIEENESYKKYSNNFGDFAIVSEYFSLPLPCSTYVEMFESEFKNYNLIKTILKIFKYESSYSSVSVGERVFPIEYRTYFYKSNELISSSNDSVKKCNQFVDEVFDYYFQNMNLLSIIILIVLIVTMIVAIVFYLSSKSIKIKSTKLLFTYLISFAIAIPFASMIAVGYKTIFDKIYSVANPLSLLIYLILIVMFLLILLLKLKKGKCNENSNY